MTCGPVTLSSYVLHVQGSGKQPLQKSGNHIVFNGQLFGIPKTYTNDTSFLLDQICEKGPLDVAASCRGPAAVILYQEDENTLWFWRDYFGRRSLLISFSGDGFVLSSVAGSEGEWKEVPACGVFRVTKESLECYPYSGRATISETFCREYFKDFDSLMGK